MQSRYWPKLLLPLSVLLPQLLLADPWAPPGDSALRHDIQVLADAGVLRTPVSTWPLSWPDIARDVLDASRTGRLNAGALHSLARVQGRARREMQGDLRYGLQVSGAEKPVQLRTFSATPREEGELTASAEWTGERFALRLQGTVAADPQDGQELRPDGSYAGVNLGNFMIGAGWMERWWGPGWQGSLIWSSNARPIPSLSIERNYSDAFNTPWLRWIGPWRASMSFGRLEGERSDVDSAQFFGMRVSFKPWRNVEIGLSRTAQWCGEGRPCGLSTFKNLWVGNDNDIASDDQPGNQLAGYDFRVTAGRFAPVAVYAQFIGEDEAGALPAKFMALAGAEAWGDSPLGQWRVHGEYANIVCGYDRSNPNYNCAYEHTLFTAGYRFRGRAIGHSLDGDGRALGVGVLLIDNRAARWELTARKVEINRDATTAQPANTVSPLAAELRNLELTHERTLAGGRLRLGIGFDDYETRLDGGPDQTTRGFVQWIMGFGG